MAKTYFVRHTDGISVGDDVLRDLYEQNRIAIHFPGDGEEDWGSIDPRDYKKIARARNVDSSDRIIFQARAKDRKKKAHQTFLFLSGLELPYALGHDSRGSVLRSA